MARGEILAQLQSEHPQIRLVLQPQNMGKGAALRRGIQEATGEYVIIQDADLEYDPAEYPRMIEPLVRARPMWCLARAFSAARHTASYISGTRSATVPSPCFPIASPTSTSPTWKPAIKCSAAK